MAQELTRESTTLYDGARSLVSIANLIDKGAERFFLIQARQDMSEEQQEDTPQSSPPWGEGPQNESAGWVQGNCEQVPKELWQPSSWTSDQEGEEDRRELGSKCSTTATREAVGWVPHRTAQGPRSN